MARKKERRPLKSTPTKRAKAPAGVCPNEVAILAQRAKELAVAKSAYVAAGKNYALAQDLYNKAMAARNACFAKYGLA